MNKNEYPWSLKNYHNPVLKKDGKPFKWGTMIPLVGGAPMACNLATGIKPQFICTLNGFQENEKHLVNYWPDVPYINMDDYPDCLNDYAEDIFEDTDFVIAIPPCAGLSQLNTGKKGSEMGRGSDAVQNRWMYITTEHVLSKIKPKVLWGENAPGLFTGLGEGVVKNLDEIAIKYGYSFSLIKTNTLLHGIPQRRERTYYFFWKDEFAPIMNYHVVPDDERPTLLEYLDQLPKGLEHENEYWNPKGVFENHPSLNWVLNDLEKCTYEEFIERHAPTSLYGYYCQNNLLDKVLEWLAEHHPEAPENKWLNHVIKKGEMDKGFWDGSAHFFNDSFNAVVTRNMGCGVHPREQRYCNVRELMWLMCLPWDFELVKDEKERTPINHLAQNVPIITTRDWCFEVMKYLNGDLRKSGQRFFRQNNNNPEVFQIAKKLF